MRIVQPTHSRIFIHLILKTYIKPGVETLDAVVGELHQAMCIKLIGEFFSKDAFISFHRRKESPVSALCNSPPGEGLFLGKIFFCLFIYLIIQFITLFVCFCLFIR